MNSGSGKNGRRRAILLLVLVLAAVFAGRSWLARRPVQGLPPDRAPQQELNACPVEEGAAVQEVPGSDDHSFASLTFSTGVGLDLSEEMAELYFVNPARSKMDLIVRVVIREETVAQSGLLRPGYRLDRLPLEPGMVARLRAGMYEGQFCVFYYDPETGVRDGVDTVIPITIQVQE